MTVFTKLGVDIAAPTDSGGTPRQIMPSDFQVWMTEAERLFYALIAGQGGDIDLPNLLIRYTITGGDENNVVATPNLPVPDAPGLALFSIQTLEENTGPVTINGKPLRTNTGNEIAPGGLAANGIYLFLDAGAEFRLLSDQASASIVAAAEAAQAAAEAAKSDAEAAAAAAEAAASSVLLVEFATKTAAEAYSPTVAPTFIRLAGYAQAGDGGGALYKEVDSEPSHVGKFSITLDDGATTVWYEIAEEVLRPAMLGAKGDGTNDDADAVEGIIRLDRPVEWGDEGNIYRITRGVSHTATKAVSWRSDGAKIVVDAPASIQAAVTVELNSHPILTQGQLYLDCQSKAFMGFWFLNNGLINVNASLYGLNVENCYRASQDFEGGDGIFLRGGFHKVLVTDFTIKNVYMAAGAGIPFEQGVSGLTVFRVSSSVDQDIVLVTNFTIENIYSEDAAYLMRDQDGIRIAQSYTKQEVAVSGTNPVTAMVAHGRFKNAMGRAVKMISEYGIVHDIQIVRNGEIHSAFTMGESEDIDFQVAGGTARGIRCYYNDNAPASVVSFNVTNTDGRRSPTQCVVDDVVITQFATGTALIKRIASVDSQFVPAMLSSVKVTIKDVQVGGQAEDLDEVVRIDNSWNIASGLYYMVSLIDVGARVDPSRGMVYRTHPSIALDMLVSGLSVQQVGTSNVALASGVLTTNITATLAGANRRVTTA